MAIQTNVKRVLGCGMSLQNIGINNRAFTYNQALYVIKKNGRIESTNSWRGYFKKIW